MRTAGARRPNPGHPSPSRAGGGGSLPGRSGKWPMGPGWLVTRGAASSPRYRVRTRGRGQGGGRTHPETLAGPSPTSAPELPQSPPRHLSEPVPEPPCPGTPRGCLRAPCDPAAPHPHPHPGPGAPGVLARSPVRSPRRALTRSRVRDRQAARAEAGGRRAAEASGKPGGGRRRRASARRWRDPRLPPTPRWRSSRLLLRPAKSGTFKNLCARNRPPARPRALPPPSAPPRRLRARPVAAVRTARRGAGRPRRRAAGAGPARGGVGGAEPSDRASAPVGRGGAGGAGPSDGLRAGGRGQVTGPARGGTWEAGRRARRRAGLRRADAIEIWREPRGGGPGGGAELRRSGKKPRGRRQGNVPPRAARIRAPQRSGRVGPGFGTGAGGGVGDPPSVLRPFARAVPPGTSSPPPRSEVPGPESGRGGTQGHSAWSLGPGAGPPAGRRV